MSRSQYKGPFFQLHLFKNNKKKTIYNKNLTIIPKYMNSYVSVYNGSRFVSLKIKENMVGYKFGEFLYTRKRFSFKKNK